MTRRDAPESAYHGDSTGAIHRMPHARLSRMRLPFAASTRSSVGLEWELMLADRETGDLVPRAPEILERLEDRTALGKVVLTLR